MHKWIFINKFMIFISKLIYLTSFGLRSNKGYQINLINKNSTVVLLAYIIACLQKYLIIKRYTLFTWTHPRNTTCTYLKSNNKVLKNTRSSNPIECRYFTLWILIRQYIMQLIHMRLASRILLKILITRNSFWHIILHPFPT